MISKKRILFVCFFMIFSLTGCRSSGNPPVEKSTTGPVGKLYYDVPKNVDLTDIISGTASRAEKEKIYGRLSLPDKVDGKIPAVVIMHASGGVFNFREHQMAKLLTQSGIAAFIPYSFASRGLKNTKSTSETGTSFGMRIADAFGALRFLSTHPNIDRQKIGIMGYSSGGFASMLSLDKKITQKAADGSLTFAAHVNVYASPTLVFKKCDPTAAPALFLMGEKDDLCPLDHMMSYIDKLKKAGGNVKAVVYPDAHHAFDSKSGVRPFNVKNSGACQFQILENGRLFDSVTGETFAEKKLYAGNKKYIQPCITKKATIGRNSYAARQYKKETVSFFVDALKP